MKDSPAFVPWSQNTTRTEARKHLGWGKGCEKPYDFRRKTEAAVLWLFLMEKIGSEVAKGVTLVFGKCTHSVFSSQRREKEERGEPRRLSRTMTFTSPAPTPRKEPAVGLLYLFPALCKSWSFLSKKKSFLLWSNTEPFQSTIPWHCTWFA